MIIEGSTLLKTPHPWMTGQTRILPMSLQLQLKKSWQIIPLYLFTLLIVSLMGRLDLQYRWHVSSWAWERMIPLKEQICWSKDHNCTCAHLIRMEIACSNDDPLLIWCCDEFDWQSMRTRNIMKKYDAFCMMMLCVVVGEECKHHRPSLAGNNPLDHLLPQDIWSTPQNACSPGQNQRSRLTIYVYLTIVNAGSALTWQ